MNRFLLLAALFACITSSSPVQAQVTIGLRAGYAFSGGKVSRNQLAISDFVTGQIPFTLEAGYKFFGRKLAVGAYLEAGPMLLTESFKNQGDSGSTVGHFAAGVQALWNFMPESAVQPWAGLGFGWDYLEVNEDFGSAYPYHFYKYNGLEFVKIQTGFDCRLTGKISAGPVIAIGIGQYLSGTDEVMAGPATKLSYDPAVHEWVSFALRGSCTF